MGTVMFFHLMQSAPADTLAVNAARALGQGWRVMVRGTDPAALDQLDATPKAEIFTPLPRLCHRIALTHR